MGHLGCDELASQRRGVRVPLSLGKVTLEDGVRGSLSEVRLEDRREGQPTAGPAPADAVSPRRHRPGR
jgi:hypothetical protein